MPFRIIERCEILPNNRSENGASMTLHAEKSVLPQGEMCADQPCFAIDAHVHFYEVASLDHALDAGRDHLLTAAVSAGYQPSTVCLCLTETSGDNAFEALASGSLVPSAWSVRDAPPGDAAALWLERRSDGATLLLIAGRQIVSEERVEVLAIATRNTFSDGKPVKAVLEELRNKQIPAILPWGVGKWLGKRGRIVDGLLAQAGPTGLMLGDNAGRPRRLRRPRRFDRAAADNVPVLPGSDPLPLPGAELGIGQFGCVFEGRLDMDRPAADLRSRLFTLRTQPIPIGQRRSLPAVIREQLELRVRKAQGRSAAPK